MTDAPRGQDRLPHRRRPGHRPRHRAGLRARGRARDRHRHRPRRLLDALARDCGAEVRMPRRHRRRGHHGGGGAFGPVDVLFNAAGFVHPAPCSTAPRTNGTSPSTSTCARCTARSRPSCPACWRAAAARSSTSPRCASSVKGAANRFVYGATKAAVIGLTQVGGGRLHHARHPLQRHLPRHRRVAVAARAHRGAGQAPAARPKPRSRRCSSRASRWAAWAQPTRSPRSRSTWPATNPPSPPAA